MEAVLTDIILPGFINFFGPGICANMIYKQNELSRTSLISYFIGILIFTIFSQIRILRPATAIFPVIGRGTMFISLKNNPQPFHLIVTWLIVLEASNALIHKLLFNKGKMTINNDKLGEIFFLILGLGLGRFYHLPDYTMILMVFLVAMGPFVQYILSFLLSFTEESGTKNPVKVSKVKVPKRKAAQKAKDTLNDKKKK